MAAINSTDTRIQILEQRVQRLATFNDILLRHILRAQNFSGTGKRPAAADVSRWLIDLSNEVYNTQLGRRRF